MVWSDAAIANLNSWKQSWNKGGLWNDINEYIPFYLLPDWKSNPLKEIFRVKFGVTVEDLK